MYKQLTKLTMSWLHVRALTMTFTMYKVIHSAIFMGKTCKCRKTFIGNKDIYSVPSDLLGIPVILVGKTFAV